MRVLSKEPHPSEIMIIVFYADESTRKAKKRHKTMKPSYEYYVKVNGYFYKFEFYGNY